MVGNIEGMDCMEHWVWYKNNEYCYAENNKKKKKVRELDIQQVVAQVQYHVTFCIDYEI